MSNHSWIYGVHAVEAILNKEPERVLELQAMESRDDARLNAVIKLARQNGAAVAWRDRAALDKLATLGT